MKQSGIMSDVVVNRVANPDARVFDICLVEPNEWWFGFHTANTTAGRWPGGVPKIDTDFEPISRAYFKLKEALLWSGMRVSEGDLCAELGSSPGGACQLLLEMGANVLAIDPAELDEEVLQHPNLIHIRRRGHEVRKREFRDVKWLFSDINMVPQYTLDTVSAIVSHDVCRHQRNGSDAETCELGPHGSSSKMDCSREVSRLQARSNPPIGF